MRLKPQKMHSKRQRLLQRLLHCGCGFACSGCVDLGLNVGFSG